MAVCKAKRRHNAITPFQKRVYKAVAKIPRGRVTTYKHLAAYLRCKSFRAVGQALRRTPFAPRVPCHRVIASNLTLGGFRGSLTGTPLQQKLKLLANEGVKFKQGRLAVPRLVYRFHGIAPIP